VHEYKVGEEVEVRIHYSNDDWTVATIFDTVQPGWASGRIYAVVVRGEPWFWRAVMDIRPLCQPTIVGNELRLPETP